MKGQLGFQGGDPLLEPNGDDSIQVGPGRDRRFTQKFLYRHRRPKDDREGVGSGIASTPRPDPKRADDPDREQGKIQFLGEDAYAFLEGFDFPINRTSALRKDAEDLGLSQYVGCRSKGLEKVDIGIYLDDPIRLAEHRADRILEKLLKAQKVQVTDNSKGEGGSDGKAINIARMIGGYEIGASIPHVF